jgi:hypothetical protein
MYDRYLRPASSYFGVKKACKPMRVQYSYDDRSTRLEVKLEKTLPNLLKSMVARDGVEPPTPAFSGLRSTT